LAVLDAVLAESPGTVTRSVGTVLPLLPALLILCRSTLLRIGREWRAMAAAGLALIVVAYAGYRHVSGQTTLVETSGSAFLYLRDPTVKTDVTVNVNLHDRVVRKPAGVTFFMFMHVEPGQQVDWALVLTDDARLEEFDFLPPATRVEQHGRKQVVIGRAGERKGVPGLVYLTISGMSKKRYSSATMTRQVAALPLFGRATGRFGLSDERRAPTGFEVPDRFTVDVIVTDATPPFRLEYAEPSPVEHHDLAWTSTDAVEPRFSLVGLTAEEEREDAVFFFGLILAVGANLLVAALVWWVQARPSERVVRTTRSHRWKNRATNP
jgi:hypothetical protein